MNIDLSKRDSVRAVVTGNNEKGVFLFINGVNKVCRIFNLYLPKGVTILASIIKIYDDYIILDLESIDYENPYYAA